jgi:hypothetical protein
MKYLPKTKLLMILIIEYSKVIILCKAIITFSKFKVTLKSG